MLTDAVTEDVRRYIAEHGSPDRVRFTVNGTVVIAGYNRDTDFDVPVFLSAEKDGASHPTDPYRLDVPAFIRGADSEDAPQQPDEILSADRDDSQPVDIRYTYITESFRDMLLRRIDEKHLTDAAVYRAAGLTRQHFSKIKNEDGYKVKKTTAVALCMAMRLSEPETKELLSKAGFSFAMDNPFDLIISYCIDRDIFDLIDVNEILYSFEQPLLGAKA